MHWGLLKFYEANNIPYYIADPEPDCEKVLAQRCFDRGNNEQFTEKMIQNLKIWNEELKKYKPIKILRLSAGDYLEDVLKREKFI